ncbi:MAG: acyl-CoA dehydrogenase family protein [Burkholderiales bacterium]
MSEANPVNAKHLATTDRIPPYEELVARAAGLITDIAARATKTEADCHVPQETVAAFRATNLHKTLLPAAYGGYEMGFSAMLDMSFAVGKVCASSAWVLGLYMVHNWFGGLFPKEAQDDMWGNNSGAFISGSYAPIGKASVVAGGFHLSGRFPFSSGVPGADWNLCAAMLPIGPEGAPIPCFTLVPKADYRIDWDSWKTVGQAGTGSFDVIVEEAFVPSHRVLSFRDALEGNSPGARANTNPLFRISLLTCVPFALAMPAVAAAAGALDTFIEENRSRTTHGAVVLGGNKIAEFQTVQKRVGEAAARIDACLLLAHRDIKAAEAEVQRDGKTSMDTRLRNRRTQSFITHEAQTAMNLIFDAVGGRCLQHHHPMQRAWRDVGAIAHHISLNFDAVMSMYGQHVFGLKLQGQY